MKRIIGILSLCAVIFSSCYNRKADDLYQTTTSCDTTTVTYSGTILPIMQQHCSVTGCHTGPPNANNLNYTQYADLAVVAANGQLIPAIEHTNTPSPMPKNQPMLDACTINKIVRWVNEGYPNN